MKQWTVLAAVAVVLAPGALFAADGPTSVPRAPMPDEVYRTLRQAIESFPTPEHTYEQWRTEELQALDALRTVPLPDLRKLERVRLFDVQSNQEAYANAWRVPGAGPDLVLLRWRWEEERLPPPDTQWPRVEPYPYTDELAELVRFLPVREAARTGEWPYKFLCRHDTMLGLVTFHDAYAAALFGKTAEARLLMHAALGQDLRAVKAAYDFACWDSFGRGVRLLQAGAPRADVLAQWQDTLQFLGSTPLAGEVKDLVAELAKQVQEDKRLAATEVKDPEGLPLQERIAYYIARFPEVHGEQRTEPGAC